MKKNISIIIAVLMLMASATLMAKDKDKKDVQRVRFETSIECENCVNTIMKNIPFEKGVKDVRCDLSTKEVTIDYQKSKTKPELLKRALERLGYSARIIPAEKK